MVLFGGAGLLGAVALFATPAERERARESLRRLEGYQVDRVTDQEMLGSFTERVLAPFADGIGGLIKRYTPSSYIDQVRHKIVVAGNPAGYEVDRHLVGKVIGTASPLVVGPLVWFGLGIQGMHGMLLVGLLAYCGFMYVDMKLDKQIEARKKKIARGLPDILDLLVISVEAGLGFDQALERTSSSVPGPLSDEFRRMLHETRIGASRADALRALDERTEVPDVRSFVLAMLQADTFGVSISKMLRQQADEMRVRRRLAAQETAQKAPIKMLFPLITCIFPGLFIVILGPAFISISQNL
jgi:tight adherence protein C